MGEYSLTHFHVGKYKKEDKMAAQMSKELQKAAKAKPKELKAKIQGNKVLFTNRKEKIMRADIGKMQRNKEKKIIVIATKFDKKKPNEIYALRFSDEKEFNEFFDALKEGETPKKSKEPEPASPAPKPEPQNSETRSRTPSPEPSEAKIASATLSPPISYATNSPDTSIDRKQRHSLSRTCSKSSRIPTPKTPTKCTRSSVSQESNAPRRPKSVGAATYVTTDTLPSYVRSSTPRRGDKVSARNAYPMQEKTVRRKDKSHTETKFLTYVPCKGMVKSTEGNVYLYSKTKPNAFTSTSPSSFLSTSSSTPAMDPLKEARLLRIVRISRSNSTSSRSSSSSSGSSSSSRRSSNASPSSSIERVNRVNVWKYQNRRASTSTSSSTSTDTATPDERVGRRRSRPGSAEYVRCPTCHRRCWLLVCRQ
ncbi:unnamed protein product [Taenia asiatica]|uniref:DUF5734 domain-containing protein n=1 Tax=Taenia asiatica TaxID=60517 RepID=A0A0R3W7H9_TAEAS|nr:unnamed protein product [Taenia asiatica]